MNYIIFVITLMVFMFSAMYIYNLFILKSKENLKITFLAFICSISIIILINFIAFISLKFYNWILPISISNYKIFILSFLSVFIILFGELITKLILSTIMAMYFNLRYKNKNLSENEIMRLVRNKHLNIEILKVCCIFLISYIVCFIITHVLNISNNYSISIFESIINSSIYFFMFRSNKYKNISSTKYK